MKASVAICATLVLLAACVADTMRSYVGQDIRAVMLAYGPPANEIDLGGGARAFQWSKISVDTTPPSAVTSTGEERERGKGPQTGEGGGKPDRPERPHTVLPARGPQRGGWVVDPLPPTPP